MDVHIGDMTSTVRADGGGGGGGATAGIAAAALEAFWMEQEHRARVHAERWIPCCAECAEEAEEEA
jgi:hypothetical protein